jgi:cbb3-type cytochrome oxidase maturation protein
MSILLLLTGVAFGLFLIGAIGLVWSARSGQWDDLDTPAQRVLGDDPSAAQETLP